MSTLMGDFSDVCQDKRCNRRPVSKCRGILRQGEQILRCCGALKRHSKAALAFATKITGVGLIRTALGVYKQSVCIFPIWDRRRRGALRRTAAISKQTPNPPPVCFITKRKRQGAHCFRRDMVQFSFRPTSIVKFQFYAQ